MRQWRVRLIIIALVCMGLGALPVLAQTGGQFCVRAFEDRDGNGEWAGAGVEPLLTSDVAVNLLNADGVVVDSGLMENSPTAAQGTLCFRFLPAGQYTAIITSGALTPTTPMSISAAVSETGEPVVVMFGAQIDTAAVGTAAETADAVGSEDQILRLALSAGGALMTMLGMAGIGVLVYALYLRRPRANLSMVTTTGTGSLPPVTPDDTPTHT